MLIFSRPLPRSRSASRCFSPSIRFCPPVAFAFRGRREREEDEPLIEPPTDDMLALDEILERFEAIEPRKAQVVSPLTGGLANLARQRKVEVEELFPEEVTRVLTEFHV